MINIKESTVANKGPKTRYIVGVHGEEMKTTGNESTQNASQKTKTKLRLLNLPEELLDNIVGHMSNIP
jgi:hypothetical protein